MRVALPIVVAILGFTLSQDHGLFGAVVGAVVGIGLAELIELRGRLSEMEKELHALRAHVVRWHGEANERRAQQTSPRTEAVEATRAAPSTPSAPAVTPAVSVRSAPTPEWTPMAAPSSPDMFESALRVVREYFTGGNTLVRAGVIVLFFGVAFLLRYLAEHTRVPIEFRLCGVAVGGIVLLMLGWRLRRQRPAYALALQGGAVGILYLTVFAGLRLYSLLPPGVAFALLAAVAIFSAALAVLQNSQAFAVLAVTGGFLAPILASTGHGSHVVLFSYFAVLNAGILLIAWFKAWRPLNLAGFVFTFLIGTAWGVLRYRPELLATSEPFLVLFFLLYLAIAILFTSRQAPELRGYVDGTLVFGTPIAAFGLQSAMLHDSRFLLAYSALAVSVLYLGLASLLHRRRRDSQRWLIEAFTALGVLFLTLAVPLALDGRWSAATWSFEGAALVWIGCRQDRRLPRAFGTFLQIAGGLIFRSDINAPHGAVPIINSVYLGGAMVTIASVFSAATLQKARERLEQYESPIAPVLFFWGLLWWLFSGLTEIQRVVPDEFDASAGLAFVAVTALVSSELSRRTRLRLARLPALWLLPGMTLYAAVAVVEVSHPLADGGWVAWPFAVAAFYFLCRRHEGPADQGLARILHVGAAWLLVALLSWEFAWAIGKAVKGGGSWPAIAWALLPASALVALVRVAKRIGGRADRRGWPLEVHCETYVAVAGAGFAAYLALWSLVSNLSLSGDPFPLPFVPLLNPLDLAQLFVLLVLLRFWWHLQAARYPVYQELQGAAVVASLAALAFIWLNAALLRTLHYWAGIPLQIEPMLRSTLVQTSLSIFWAVLALATMLAATREGSRIVWLTGAGLLTIVIGKLFIVDLSRVGTVERIVSFVVVGVLMLVVGYFSPLPPARAETAAPGKNKSVNSDAAGVAR